MTAIAGLWRHDGRPDGVRDLARMLAAQQIYGPDDTRQSSDGAVTLGRCLFRSLPEDRFDRQPLQTGDARLTLVADVRLDNRAELAAALGLPVARIGARCDAALLLDCLERWGERTVDRLTGDFAFACWDERAQALMLARDFRGNRPLHVHRGNGFIAFASMPKGLHALAEVPRAANRDAAADFLMMQPAAGTATFWDAIERVPPGTILTVTRTAITARAYWQPARPDRAAPRRDHVEGVRHLLDEAVLARLRGAGDQVGAHLSAGLDSAAVASTAARLLAGQGRVAAFTASPHPDHEPLHGRHLIADEAPLAAATAALYDNIDHHLVRAGNRSPLAALDRDYYLFDMPLLNRCNMTWWTGIHDEAKALGLRVMLTGEIGNMSLSYAGEEYLPELLRSGRLLELARVAAALLRTGTLRKRGLVGRLLFPFLPPAIERRVRGEHDAAIPGHNAMAPTALARFQSGDQGAKTVSERAWRDGFAMRLHVMGRHDPGNHNKGYLAGWKIDQRDPTGDRRLVEYMLAAPMADYVAGGRFRSLPRRVLADRLPPAVLGEPGKGRQGADWHLGLTAARAELREELDRLRASGVADSLLDLDRLDALERNWPSSGWASQKVQDDYRLALLRGISVGHFLRKTSGGNA